jgi:uncharacterized protein (DUF927 family)
LVEIFAIVGVGCSTSDRTKGFASKGTKELWRKKVYDGSRTAEGCFRG